MTVLSVPALTPWPYVDTVNKTVTYSRPVAAVRLSTASDLAPSPAGDPAPSPDGALTRLCIPALCPCGWQLPEPVPFAANICLFDIPNRGRPVLQPCETWRGTCSAHPYRSARLESRETYISLILCDLAVFGLDYVVLHGKDSQRNRRSGVGI